MLKELGYNNLDELIAKTVPEKILLKENLSIGEPNSEYKALRKLRDISQKNKIYSNFIGMGYYGNYTPYVILRNILENPGWYTAYTPYQAEVAQGRLEALLNYQTVICDLTGMEISNASLLDEGTSAAEAMTMLFGCRSRDQIKNGVNKFVISSDVFDQTISVLETRAEPLGIEIEIADYDTINQNQPILGANDGGSGVAVLLELARIFCLQKPNIGIDLILFDAEDYGQPENSKYPIMQNSWCLGSQYWSKNPHKKNYFAKYGILLDMVGAKDAVFTFEETSHYYNSCLLYTSDAADE